MPVHGRLGIARRVLRVALAALRGERMRAITDSQVGLEFFRNACAVGKTVSYSSPTQSQHGAVEAGAI